MPNPNGSVKYSVFKRMAFKQITPFQNGNLPFPTHIPRPCSAKIAVQPCKALLSRFKYITVAVVQIDDHIFQSQLDGFLNISAIIHIAFTQRTEGLCTVFLILQMDIAQMFLSCLHQVEHIAARGQGPVGVDFKEVGIDSLHENIHTYLSTGYLKILFMVVMAEGQPILSHVWRDLLVLGVELPVVPCIVQKDRKHIIGSFFRAERLEPIAGFLNVFRLKFLDQSMGFRMSQSPTAARISAAGILAP